MHGIDSVLKARSVDLMSAPLRAPRPPQLRRATLVRPSAVTPDIDEIETDEFLGFTREAVDAAFRTLLDGVPHR